MNRRERRTQGKAIMERLTQLRNSKIINSPYLRDLTPEDQKALKDGTHSNADLQTLFNKANKLIKELVYLEGELYQAQTDLKEKRGLSNPKPTDGVIGS